MHADKPSPSTNLSPPACLWSSDSGLLLPRKLLLFTQAIIVLNKQTSLARPGLTCVAYNTAVLLCSPHMNESVLRHHPHASTVCCLSHRPSPIAHRPPAPCFPAVA